MEPSECAVRRAAAADVFNDAQDRADGVQVANSLSFGLTTLRSLLYMRVHEDVQRNIGSDSMLLPASYLASEKKTKIEIELFQVAESADAVRGHRYLSDDSWYVDWLSEMRLGEAYREAELSKRVERYLHLDADDRRYTFTRVLEKTFRQATRAPLVLFKLFPPAVHIVTAIAFRDVLTASELRNRQLLWLPAIADCYECHGRPLENGEKCQVCGNPVWNYDWLTAYD